MKDHTNGHKITQDRWSLVRDAMILKSSVVLPGMCGLSRQVVSQGRFNCSVLPSWWTVASESQHQSPQK